MSSSELETVLEPLVAQLQNGNEIVACMVALLGVIVGVLLVMLLSRRF